MIQSTISSNRFKRSDGIVPSPTVKKKALLALFILALRSWRNSVTFEASIRAKRGAVESRKTLGDLRFTSLIAVETAIPRSDSANGRSTLCLSSLFRLVVGE